MVQLACTRLRVCLSVCLSVLPWSLMLRLLRVTLEQHRSAASYFDDYYFARPRGKVPTPNSAEFPVHASCLWRSWLSPRLTTTQCVMYFRSVDDVIFSHNGVTMHRYHYSYPTHAQCHRNCTYARSDSPGQPRCLPIALLKHSSQCRGYCDQETNIQQYALGPTVSKTHLCHTL